MNTVKIENRYRYTSREFVETNLYYYRARHMRPDLGRFISMDPLKTVDGTNMFGYVVNDPVSYVDSNGTDTWSGTCVTGTAFLFVVGKSYTRCALINWETGEYCNLRIKAFLVGVGLDVGVSGASAWIVGGPMCCKDLEGPSTGFTISVSAWIRAAGGGASVGGEGDVTFNLGAGVGLPIGGAGYLVLGDATIISKAFTPCKCNKD